MDGTTGLPSADRAAIWGELRNYVEILTIVARSGLDLGRSGGCALHLSSAGLGHHDCDYLSGGRVSGRQVSSPARSRGPSHRRLDDPRSRMVGSSVLCDADLL